MLYCIKYTDSQSASDAFLPSEVVIFSGTRGVWLWRSRWHLSILYKKGLLRSHTAGRFPARESPSCVAWYRLLPGGALVCRFWSRSDEHSKTLQCSLMIVDRGLLHALRRWWPKYFTMTLQKKIFSLLWHGVLLDISLFFFCLLGEWK